MSDSFGKQAWYFGWFLRAPSGFQCCDRRQKFCSWGIRSHRVLREFLHKWASHEAEVVTPIEPTITASNSRSGRVCTMPRRMAKSKSRWDFYGTSGMHYMAKQSTTAFDETPEDLFHMTITLTYKNICRIRLHSMLRWWVISCTTTMHFNNQMQSSSSMP